VGDWVKSFGFGPGPTETYAMLDRINRAISAGFAHAVRETEGVQPPTETLTARVGACRDYAALFVDACRHLGLAARFVSGYSHGPATEVGNAATHAWAEVYLPGAGWKGFDPSSGEVTGSHHIPVAVARHPEAVPPISGSFVGIPQRPALWVNVQVTAL
jgi:transglutaminase-like putative cysteine protease